MERKSRSYGITNTLKRTLLITSLILKENIEPETILQQYQTLGFLNHCITSNFSVCKTREDLMLSYG